MRRLGLPLVVASLVVAVGLLGLVWIDYRATRAELLGLLRDQAHALRDSVAAALRANRAAGLVAETQLAERLRDQARALAQLDLEGRLSAAAVEEVRRRDPLFRVTVLKADGTRDDLVTPLPADDEGGGPAEPRGPRGGFGRGRAQGGGRGQGAGRGYRGGGVVRQILEEGKPEVVTGVHVSRWGGGERLAAGVKRPRGGAITVTVEASAVARLQKPASLDALLEEITRSSPEIAYTVFEHEQGRLAFGDVPEDPPPGTAVSRHDGAGEVEREVRGRPILEFASDVPLEGGTPALLRLGLRLDGVRRVEERMLLRLAATVAASSALVGLAFGLAGLRRRYGALSERHARAEEALRRRDRLAAMGELASTVAHEVRNPLNAVGMTAQRLRREFLEGGAATVEERRELEELLGVMATETQRIDRIVQQFLDYARPPKLATERTDLSTLVRDLAERTRPLAEARGLVLEVEAAEPVEASVDPGQLRQALDNLLRNAIDATPDGGRVVLSLARGKDDVTLEVRDTGRGIEPDHLPRIFDLYFTTKADGTGVGLAVTQQIVTAHGGRIDVESEPGRGTSMIVRLPAGRGETRG
jgi:signal transduction histidine kinase